jgi:hypothetical protein
LCTSTLIQGYFIPKVYPQFNQGDGLVVLDSTGFNKIAKDKSDEILKNGWGAWELRPKGQSPAGIASIFYALWAPKPYAMLPFNALVHALSGCVVLWFLLHFFSRKSSILGASIFVLNPAALEWVAQIHRDGIFILGNLLVLVCLIQLGKGLRQEKAGVTLWGVIYGVLGTSVVWVARPHWVQVALITFFLCACFIGVHSWGARGRHGAV